MLTRNERGLGHVLLVVLWIAALAILLSWAEAHAQPATDRDAWRGADPLPALMPPALGRRRDPAPEGDPREPEAPAVTSPIERALLARVTLGGVPGRFAGHCRSAPGGCRARVHRIAVAIEHEAALAGIDPWLVAAIATIESGLDAGAVGPAGELGLLQLHPRGRAAHRALAACAADPDRRRCGVYLVREGVRLLAAALASCGDLARGLSAYHTGRCVSRSGAGESYAARVLRRRAALVSAGMGGA